MGWQDTGLVQVRGHDLCYHRAGAGLPVLLVHGITTYSFIWRRVAPVLIAAGYDVVAVDLLGCGESDKRIDLNLGLKAHAGYLLEFADLLGLERFHLVGHDLGGGMAQLMAVEAPGRFLSLALVNTVARDFWPVQPIIAIRTPVIRQIMMAALDFGALDLIVRRGLYHKHQLTRELLDLFARPLATTEGRKAFMHFAHCLDNRELTAIADRLRGLRVPTMIVRGDADVYLTGEIADWLWATIPASWLERIGTAGHFIQEDEPEWLAEQLIRGFRGRAA